MTLIGNMEERNDYGSFWIGVEHRAISASNWRPMKIPLLSTSRTVGSLRVAGLGKCNTH